MLPRPITPELFGKISQFAAFCREAGNDAMEITLLAGKAFPRVDPDDLGDCLEAATEQWDRLQVVGPGRP